MHLVLLVRKLEIGGAESQLLCLAKGLKERGHDVNIVTFYPGGRLEDKFLLARIPIFSLKKKSRWHCVGPIFRFLRFIKRTRVEVIYSLLTGPNVFALLGKVSRPKVRIFWGVRASAKDREIRPNDRFVSFLAMWSAWLSRWSEKIIVNSQSAKFSLVQQGYVTSKIAIIRNGIDRDQFRFAPDLGDAYRHRNNISPNHFIVGMVARLDPIKNYEMYIEGATCFIKSDPNSMFLIVGSGDTNYQEKLRDMVTENGVENNVIFCGDNGSERVVEILNALDVFVLTSRSESFSNALAEALMCGVPSITTNVGDNQEILGTNDGVIDSGDTKELVQKLKEIQRRKTGFTSRRDSASMYGQRFGVDRMIDETIACLDS